eukprot:CAMPEP_0168522750 /NCGR_PEP_ID=MMETSP0405-20121227/9532_1 /TAXON_ID=498012 /ORGANISM="Trichosphaerium sp, Strain Am-I-7 wt" /LENGTH=237 /DNA_ID=CAMNT_0008544409 /DNA_START=187 /DNA_END=900 /DNA_ORIENTATION=+
MMEIEQQQQGFFSLEAEQMGFNFSPNRYIHPQEYLRTSNIEPMDTTNIFFNDDDDYDELLEQNLFNSINNDLDTSFYLATNEQDHWDQLQERPHFDNREIQDFISYVPPTAVGPSFAQVQHEEKQQQHSQQQSQQQAQPQPQSMVFQPPNVINSAEDSIESDDSMDEMMEFQHFEDQLSYYENKEKEKLEQLEMLRQRMYSISQQHTPIHSSHGNNQHTQRRRHNRINAQHQKLGYA